MMDTSMERLVPYFVVFSNARYIGISFGSLGRLSQVSLHSHHLHSNYETFDKKHYVNCNINRYNSDQIDEYAGMSCIGQNITDYIDFQRIISILAFYSNNYNNYKAINKYLDIYNMTKYLTNDHIHISHKHLNQDNIPKSNKQFNITYKTINQSHLVCDIANYYSYKRNHRPRQTQFITSQSDEYNIAMFVDMLDAIHCYCIHSVDTGYRNIDKSIINNDSNTDIYNAYNTDITQSKLQQILFHINMNI